MPAEAAPLAIVELVAAGIRARQATRAVLLVVLAFTHAVVTVLAAQ
jgi:hypothetical protein